MKKLRVGIIGCGNISKLHIQSYQRLENVELVACADINFERAKEYAALYGFKRAYPSAEAMMAGEELDAVSVCTWCSAHAECTIAALKGGAHVLCEKPMAMNTAQAEEMLKTAQACGKLLMVGYVRRFGENVALIKKRIEAGEFGTLYYAKSGCLRRAGNPGGWFSDSKRAGGGALIDLGVHMVDLACYVIGKPKALTVSGTTFQNFGLRDNIKGIDRYIPIEPSNFCDVEDMAVALIRFDNGVTVYCENSWSQHIEKDHLFLEVYGNKAGAVVEPYVKVMGEKDDLFTDETPAYDYELQGMESNFRREIAHFVDCVANGTPCLNPAEDGLLVNRILDAIYESARTGREVALS